MTVTKCKMYKRRSFLLKYMETKQGNESESFMNNQWQKLEWAKLVYADLHFNPRCVLSIPACTSNIYSSKRVRHERQVPSLTQQYSISIPEKVNSDKVDRGRTPKCRNIRKFSELYVVTDDEMHPQNMQCHCRTTVTPLRPSPDHHLKGSSNEIEESLQTR